MGEVILNISMSLDGFVAGPNDSPSNPMGDGGMQLFEWTFSGDTEIPTQDGQMTLKLSKESADLFLEGLRMTGALVGGRRVFDHAGAWEGHPPVEPCFIVTHHPPPEWVKPGSPFTFVTDGVPSAIHQAKQAAGDKNVAIATPSVAQQALKAGLLDAIYIDLVPVLLGGGVSLFDRLGGEPIALERLAAIPAPGVTHLRYRVIKPSSQS